MTELSTGARIATWVVAVTSLLLVVVGNVIAFVIRGGFDVNADDGILAIGLAAPVLGLILVLRAGAVRMGALLLGMGFALGFGSLAAGVPSSPDYLEWLPLVPLGNAGWMVFLALTIVGLPLLFPTGNPLTPRWRPVLWSLLILLPVVGFTAMFSEQLTVPCSSVYEDETPCAEWEASGATLSIQECKPIAGPLGRGIGCQAMLDNPIGIAGVPNTEVGLFGSIMYGLLLLLSAVAIVSFAIRFRRAGPVERRQIKLVFFVLGIFVVSGLIEGVVGDFMGGWLPVIEILDFLMWVAIPVSIFLAITRYRLYDIDRLISRTVGYAIVVGVLVGVVALPATLIGIQFSEPWVVAATTLGVAAVFNPLRRRVQDWVDHRFNRSKYDAERVMDEFAGSLRDEVHVEEVVEGWTRTVSETMQPSAMGVWVRQ